MAKKKMASENTDSVPDSESKKKDPSVAYATYLAMKGSKQERRQYDAYVRDFNKRMRRLEREARGEFVPGDYDGGY